MSASGLRIVPIYSEKPERTADDILRDMEAMTLDALAQGKKIEAFEVCLEDWATLTIGKPDLPFFVQLSGHKESTIIRRQK